MAILSKGCKLGYSESSSVTSYTNLENLKSIPDIGGDPEKVEVTTLADSCKKYIAGLKDYGDLEFGFYYDGPEGSYGKLSGLQTAGTDAAFQLELPDGTKFNFSATVAVTISGAEANAALEFKAKLMLSSDVTKAE